MQLYNRHIHIEIDNSTGYKRTDSDRYLDSFKRLTEDIVLLKKKYILVQKIHAEITSHARIHSDYTMNNIRMNETIEHLYKYLTNSELDLKKYKERIDRIFISENILNISTKNAETLNLAHYFAYDRINWAFERYYKLINFIMLPIEHPELHKLKHIDKYMTYIDPLLFNAYPKSKSIIFAEDISKKNV